MKWFSINGILTEMKRIRWPKAKDLFHDSGICVVFVLFLGIFFFRFLDGFVHSLVYLIPKGMEKWLAVGLILYYMTDFSYTLWMEMTSEEEEEGSMVGRLKIY